MFDTFADTIVLTGNADAAFATRVAGHIESPTGPVSVTGGPGTGKTYAITQAVRAAGLSIVVVYADSLSAYDTEFMFGKLDVTKSEVVLLVESDQDLMLDREMVAVLRDLAAHPRVLVTFFITTVTTAVH